MSKFRLAGAPLPPWRLASYPGSDAAPEAAEEAGAALEARLAQQMHVVLVRCQRLRHQLLDGRCHPLSRHAHQFPVLLPGAEEVLTQASIIRADAAGYQQRRFWP